MKHVAILAGGRARRLGGCDKGAVRLHSEGSENAQERLIDTVMTSVKTQQHVLAGGQIVIAGKHDYGLGLKVIFDGPVSKFAGPVAGIYAVYHWCVQQKNCVGFFSVPCDTPSLPLDLLACLSAPCVGAVAATPAHTHYTCAYWRLQDLRMAWAELSFAQSSCVQNPKTSPSLRALAQYCRLQKVYWQEESLFSNINTPEDIKAWR